MAEIQYIPKNWEKEIETRFSAMEAAQRLALSHPPGKENEAAWDLYEGASHDLLGYLTTHFESPQGFSNFLRVDLENKLIKAALSPDVLSDDGNWDLERPEKWMVADAAKSIYQNVYQPILESIAHKNAFHHASPFSDFNP